MYTAPIDDIVRAHGVNVMLYADDTQMYIMFKNTEREESLERLNACITDVKIWATRNKLSLNDAKTEVIHFTSKFRRDPCFLMYALVTTTFILFLMLEIWGSSLINISA